MKTTLQKEINALRCLSDIEKKHLKKCISRYSTPSNFKDWLKYLILRVWNAVKSLFHRSDWQKGVKVMKKLIQIDHVPLKCLEFNLKGLILRNELKKQELDPILIYFDSHHKNMEKELLLKLSILKVKVRKLLHLRG